MSTILLSLDTSTTETGIAIFKNGRYEKSYTIKSNVKSNKLTDMIQKIYQEITNISPQIVICEDMCIVRNASTSRILSELIGAVRGICISQNIFFDKLRPNEWRALNLSDKEKLPKKREDCKEWSKHKAKLLFNKDFSSDNESDAVLIGQAYINLTT